MSYKASNMTIPFHSKIHIKYTPWHINIVLTLHDVSQHDVVTSLVMQTSICRREARVTAFLSTSDNERCRDLRQHSLRKFSHMLWYGDHQIFRVILVNVKITIKMDYWNWTFNVKAMKNRLSFINILMFNWQ